MESRNADVVTANDTLDCRDLEELREAFEKAGRIITKDYIAELDQRPVRPMDKTLAAMKTSDSVRLFPVTRIVFDKDEDSLDKLVNLYASMAGMNCSPAMIIRSDGTNIELYLGTTDAATPFAAKENTNALCSNLVGNFPGSLDKVHILTPDEVNRVAESCTDTRLDSIVSVSGIGSSRSDKDPDNDRFAQGFEKLIDTMHGRPFTAIILADHIGREETDAIRADYETLYSELSPFVKSDLSLSDADSSSWTKTMSESLSRAVTNGDSRSMSIGTSQSKSATDGTSDNWSGNILFLRRSTGKSYSSSETSGSSKTIQSSDSYSESEATASTNGTTNGLTKTSGRTLQITYQNKAVQNLLDRLDEQLDRLKEGENYGLFATAAYFLAEDVQTARMAASAYKGLINGDSTHVETIHINCWEGDPRKTGFLKEYLKKLRHPEFVLEDNQTVTPAAVVSGRELAVQMGLPRKTLPGITVLKTASFGRNITVGDDRSDRQIELGHIYHMGREEQGLVPLDVDSLTMHTFITGSTGKGKSNAVYSILERVVEKQVSFLAIEPVKGEYKNKFGNCPGVYVFGTNKNKTPLLRINPFSFPGDVHVLEHIDRLVEIFNVCWPMYAAMPAVLKDAMERAYVAAGWDLTESTCRYADQIGKNIYPSFVDLLKMITVVMEESQYSAETRGDYIGALCTRVRSLTNGIYGQIFTADELPSEVLFDSNVIADLSRIGSVETKSLLMGILIMKMQEYRASSTAGYNHQLRHITVLEEAHNLLKRTSTEQSTESSNMVGKSVEMLANSIAEMRTYGEGFIIVDQAPGLLDMAVIRNTNTKIILGLPDISDRELVGRAASLNDSQIDELAKLPTGVAAVYQNNWAEPVLCKVNRCRQDEAEYVPVLFGSDTTSDVKMSLNQYLQLLMLPAPEKKRIDCNELTKYEKSIVNAPFTADVKINLLRFIRETDNQRIQDLRSLIVFDLLYAETKQLISAAEQQSIKVWYDAMVEKLDPYISFMNQVQKDKVLAIITHENERRHLTKNAHEVNLALMSLISDNVKKG